MAERGSQMRLFQTRDGTLSELGDPASASGFPGILFATLYLFSLFWRPHLPTL